MRIKYYFFVLTFFSTVLGGERFAAHNEKNKNAFNFVVLRTADNKRFICNKQVLARFLGTPEIQELFLSKNLDTGSYSINVDLDDFIELYTILWNVPIINSVSYEAEYAQFSKKILNCSLEKLTKLINASYQIDPNFLLLDNLTWAFVYIVAGFVERHDLSFAFFKEVKNALEKEPFIAQETFFDKTKIFCETKFIVSSDNLFDTKLLCALFSFNLLHNKKYQEGFDKELDDFIASLKLPQNILDKAISKKRINKNKDTISVKRRKKN